METNLKKSNSSKPTVLKKNRRFRFLDYALTVQVVNRSIVVESPDFKFPIPVVRPFNPPSIETAGRAIMAAWVQINDYLVEMDKRSDEHPTPKIMKESFSKLAQLISLSEACRILGLKPTMLRELADSGKIPCKRTPKGHRRFLKKDLENYSL